MIHFWTEATLMTIRQLSYKNQPAGDRFLYQKLFDTFNRFFIHVVQISQITSWILKPNFYEVFIVAITPGSKSNILPTKITCLRAATKTNSNHRPFINRIICRKPTCVGQTCLIFYSIDEQLRKQKFKIFISKNALGNINFLYQNIFLLAIFNHLEKVYPFSKRKPNGF